MIVKKRGFYEVRSSEGRNLGRYQDLDNAKHRLRQVEFFKYKARHPELVRGGRLVGRVGGTDRPDVIIRGERTPQNPEGISDSRVVELPVLGVSQAIGTSQATGKTPVQQPSVLPKKGDLLGKALIYGSLGFLALQLYSIYYIRYTNGPLFFGVTRKGRGRR